VHVAELEKRATEIDQKTKSTKTTDATKKPAKANPLYIRRIKKSNQD